jgi:hypothetical protein
LLPKKAIEIEIKQPKKIEQRDSDTPLNQALKNKAKRERTTNAMSILGDFNNYFVQSKV